MIVIKNLGKEYQPKKGVRVVALNGINLTLADTGVVFLLGKSGSGKSTLLNLLGGLDVPTTGHFEINGQSSVNFKQSDYDSYRNTYLGFIFQEYNILEEFSVGVNIGLALELQGKKATTEDIANILQQVDLAGLGNRKPNELSGGQKQRVAIARALIKDPQIIMADEPTGALDSNTGASVFDTLRKLGKDKLVIIVSHDRENAELYADRIIELADGAVISDETKNTTVSTTNDTLESQFVGGYALSDDDAKLIKDYISGVRTPSKSKHHFSATKEDSITSTQTTDSGKMIASKLPLTKAFKMGASPLRAKPIRLAFTIFLCLVAFTTFGLMDTAASFNYVDAYYDAIASNGYETATLQQQIKYYNNYTEYYSSSGLTEEQMESLQQSLSTPSVPKLSTSGLDLSLDHNDSSLFYYSGITSVVTMTSEDFSSFGYEVTGSLPTETDEIMLSYYMFEAMQENGIRLYSASSYEDFGYLNKTVFATKEAFLQQDLVISINGDYYKITGFFDTGLQDDATYDELKTSSSDNYSYDLQYELSLDLSNSLSRAMVVCDDLFESLAVEVGNNSNNGSICVMYHYSETAASGRDGTLSRIETFDKDANYITYYNGGTLTGNDILISEEFYLASTTYITYTINSCFDEYGLISLNGLDPVCDNDISFNSDNYLNLIDAQKMLPANIVYSFLHDNTFTDEELYEYFAFFCGDYCDDTLDPETNAINIAKEYLANYGVTDDVTVTSLTQDQLKAIIAISASFYYEDFNDPFFVELVDDITQYIRDILFANVDEVLTKLSGELSIQSNQYNYIEANVVGLTSLDSTVIVASADMAEANALVPHIYSGLYILLPTEAKEVKEIISLGLEDGDAVIYKTFTPLLDVVESVSSILVEITELFLYVGIAFAIFSMLMMYNFISVSINYKRSEIGILRAIGSRSNDVFKIFFAESLIISCICFVLASIATTAIANVGNNFLAEELDITIKLFMVSIRQFALIFAISMATAFIASFLPVKKIASERPIDAIRGK
ncbi:MAG: ATP-binding cassette domain-containing protein [Bacillota bacterium]